MLIFMLAMSLVLYMMMFRVVVYVGVVAVVGGVADCVDRVVA